MSIGMKNFELSEFEKELLGTYVPSRAAVLEKYTYYQPFRGNYPITQYPHSGHWALDWGMPNGTKLYSPFPRGVVSFAGYTPDGYAYNLRIIDNEQKLMCVLAHMPSNNPFRVKVGQLVTYETHVGFSNNTGNSTGPHLHFEIRPIPYTSCYMNVLSDLDKLPSTPPPPPMEDGIKVKTRQPCKIFAAPSKSSSVVARLPFGGYSFMAVDHDGEWARISGKKAKHGYIRWVMLRKV